MQKLASLVALLVLASPALGRQTGDSKSQTTQSRAADTQSSQDLRDLTASRAALLTDSEDLAAMGESLNDVELDTEKRLHETASQGIMEVDAAIWFVALYDKMQCEPDREIAKVTLKNRLIFYAGLLSVGAEGLAGYLSLTKLPAVAQSGARVRDELRGAKTKMDAIASSLK